MRPTTLVSGFAYNWTEGFSGYSDADGWAVKYRLLGPTGFTPIDVDATPDGSDWEFDITNQFAAVAAGQYKYAIIATKIAENPVTLALAFITMAANVAASGAVYTKGYWRLRYEQLQVTYATLSAKATQQEAGHNRAVTYQAMEKVRAEMLLAQSQMNVEEGLPGGNEGMILIYPRTSSATC